MKSPFARKPCPAGHPAYWTLIAVAFICLFVLAKPALGDVNAGKRAFSGKGNLADWQNASQYFDKGTGLLVTDGKYEEAIPYFKKALSIYPYDADCLLNLGLAEKRKGDFQAAVAAYKSALELTPKDWATWYALAGVYYQIQDYPNSLAAAKQALPLAPDDMKAKIQKGIDGTEAKLRPAAETNFPGM